MNTDEPFDRTTDPELTGLFDALDELATAPADPTLRTAQIGRAAAIAREAAAGTVVSPVAWSWRRSASWRVAAVAAATAAIVAGLGADDRLPKPAQRVVSSVADAVGLDVPDGSERDASPDDTNGDGTAGDSGTTPATAADPGGPGEPATPATPATPGNDDNGGRGNAPEAPRRAEPAVPAQPGESDEPTTPASPATPSPPATNRSENSAPGQGGQKDKATKDKLTSDDGVDDDDDEQGDDEQDDD